MELSSQILSDIIVHMKYAKFLPKLGRRETWEELVTRNKEMHIRKFPFLKEEIEQVYKTVYGRKALPSMRSLQFGGKSIEIAPNRSYNCAYAPIDHIDVFSEIMFMLLGGVGFGYSVQTHHIEQLPAIRGVLKRKRRFLIGDSIEGWADAIKVLMYAYFKGKSDPEFDYSDIRAKGAQLVTSGGKAPGPQPLKDCIHNIRKILDEKESDTQLTSLEAHDIICHIADAVLSGGIRRAALIALFSVDDESMLTAKSGNWFDLYPHRQRANNSVVILRHKIKKAKFQELWDRIKASNAGEPGIYFTHDKDWGTNPCCEIGLRRNQLCNLTETDVSDVNTQEELENRVRAATFIGTLQASYTDFHYLRDVWKRNTEKDALIGVSQTGIGANKLKDLDLVAAAKVVIEENKRVAALIGINPAARLTTVKPSGTASLVLGTSSGIHPWHSPYYMRRLRVMKNEAIYLYLNRHFPIFVEDDYHAPSTSAVISIPQKAPDGSVFRDEPVQEFLERVSRWNTEWVRTGHIRGQNAHNVSATVTVKEDEWDLVRDWMWKNKGNFNGLSVLPYDGTVYKQLPFEECTKEEYEEKIQHLKAIRLEDILEQEDYTDLAGELACAGGSCEIF